MSDSTQHSKKLRVAATLHDESGQSPFWATVVLYEDLRAAAVCRGATSRESEELARRLVACWNAFDGLDTELVESMVNVPEFFFKQVELLAQRDELLAGLQMAYIAMQHMGNVLNNIDAVDEEEDAQHDAAFEAVAALIAKHKEASHG
jgi:hypothetical protein